MPRAEKEKELDPREWPEELRTLGDRLRHLRGRMKVTQRWLGEQSGVDSTTISNLENGKRLASLSSLISLAKTLHAPVPWLVFGLGDLPGLPDDARPPPDAADQRRRDTR